MFQGLALRFLVAAEHQELLWRVGIQADHVPEFRFELGIVGEFVGVLEARLEVLESCNQVM